MTFPVYFHLFGQPLHAHQVLEFFAYMAGFQLYLYLRRRWPRGPAMTIEQTAWVVIGAIFGALIGAKVLAWAESFPDYWAHRDQWQILLGGKTIVGAILGGWIGVEIAKRRLGIGHPSGDIYVFPVILGMCIGRIGCFLEGPGDATWGLPTSLPWGVVAPYGTPPVPTALHPAPLYEVVYLIALAAVFAWRIRSGRQRGCMFSQFVFGYLAWRVAVEFIKPVHAVPYIHLSAIQLASLGGMVYGLFHWRDQCCGEAELTNPPSPARKGEGLDAPIASGVPIANQPASTFVELTNSLCPTCLTKVEAKVLLDSGQVFLQKFCPVHGSQRVLIADDAAYWQRARNLSARTPTPPQCRQTALKKGCPHDCGLCPDHEQHTCLAIVEITDQCNLSCPVCYAASTAGGSHRSLAQIEVMLDAVVAGEGHPAVVQISGGEPTTHPDLFAILTAARARPIRHLMLNTNGLRIAEDDGFVQRLATYMPGFEVYLQFDSLRPDTLLRLRGRDLSALRRRAVEALNRHKISTNLVVTLQKGLNDQEIGEILDFATSVPSIRGVTFQPIQAAGRLEGIQPAADRLTLTEVRTAILRQHTLFSEADLVPVPCHPDCLAMAYALRHGDKLVPLSKLVDPAALLAVAGDTICYEQDLQLRQHVRQAMSARPTAAGVARDLKLQCCLPLLPADGSPIAYDRIFRVIIMQFMDAWSMDLRSLKRSCVHIATPDGRLVPFETYNLLHRGCSTSPGLPSGARRAGAL